MKIGDLQQKMQERLQDDQKMIEQATQKSLNDLEANLKKFIQSVATTIKGDMAKITKPLKKFHWKASCFNAILAIAMIAGLFLGSEGIMYYMRYKITSYQTEIENLELEYKTQSQSLKELTTLGIIVHRFGKKGDYLEIPKNMKATLGANFDNGNQSIKIEKK